MIKRSVFYRLGEADEVVELIDIDREDPGDDKVLVKVKASPINPADFLRCRGQLGPVQSFPSPVGGEGVGIVEKVILFSFLRTFRKNGAKWRGPRHGSNLDPVSSAGSLPSVLPLQYRPMFHGN